MNSNGYVIIVGASDLVLPAYRIAKNDLSLGTIAFDYNPDAPAMIEADIPVVVSTKDIEECVRIAQGLSKIHPIKGVFTCGADVETTVATIADALSLPGIPISVAKRCNDKRLMHNYLDMLGFKDKANYRLVNTENAAIVAAKEIGFPCIIKPIDNCASRGVQRLENIAEIEEAYQLAVSFNFDNNPEVLIEECLQGSKHTVEMITWNGECHLLSIIDTHYISPRWPCETRLNTTVLKPPIQRQMFDFSKHVASLMGVSFNAHKVDLNIDLDGKIKLIELTARLSGGFHCQYASPLAFGSNDIRAALKLAVGLPLDQDDIRHRHERGSAVRALLPEPGRIVSISGVEEALTAPGIKHVFIWKKVGQTTGPYRNSADRPAFIIADGETTADAIANAEYGASKLMIKTEPL